MHFNIHYDKKLISKVIQNAGEIQVEVEAVQ